MRRSRPSLSTDAGGHGAELSRRIGFAGTEATAFGGSTGLTGDRSLSNVNSFISILHDNQPPDPGET
jgi:hypothetical protein